MAKAREDGFRIRQNRMDALSVRRVLVGHPWISERELKEAIVEYHREAMDRAPSFVRYPEARPWVERVRAYVKELKTAGILNDTEIAIAISLGDFLLFRGARQFGLKRPEPAVEKCRTALLLETDEGPFQIKNVDNPAIQWKPAPPLPAQLPMREFWWEQCEWIADGVGSGLHIDEEPEEIFPLPVLAMASEHAHDTPAVVDFLRRYSAFWGASNLLVYDHKYRMAAIEKCSRNHFETYPPTLEKWGHISGMVCRDGGSPLGRYQRERRTEYRRLYGLPEDGVDETFWKFCDAGERMLVEGIRKLGRRPKVKDVMDLFWTPYPDGLCKGGYRFHPDQGDTEYTLVTYAVALEQGIYYRWQRGRDLAVWPKQPEVCRFE